MDRRSLVGIFLFSLLGCGVSATREEILVPVSGTVKLNGRPAEQVKLLFYPTADNKALGGCWAITDDQGEYTVKHISNKGGIPPGAYNVIFSRFVTPEGDILGENESPTMTKCTESIAPMWSDLSKAKSHNKVIITDKGSSNQNFNISGVPVKK